MPIIQYIIANTNDTNQYKTARLLLAKASRTFNALHFENTIVLFKNLNHSIWYHWKGQNAQCSSVYQYTTW